MHAFKPFSLQFHGGKGCSMVVVIMAVTVVLVVALVAILPVVIVMSSVAAAVEFIVNGMVAPIRVIPFPAMKALKPPWFTDNPDMARAQIVILTADKADVFVTVPGVIIRIHPHRYHGCGRFHGHAAIGPDHAPGHQCRGRETANTQRYLIRAIHNP